MRPSVIVGQILVILALLGGALMVGQGNLSGGLEQVSAETLAPAAYLPLLISPPPDVTIIPPDDLNQELTVATLINQQRQAHGLPALHVVESLTQAARRHSRDMADHDFTSHTGSDGSNGGQRMLEAGYQWAAWGEIIAWGFGGNPEAVVDWWMNSAIHRSLILSDTYQDFGVGYAYQTESTYRHYWTVNFGRPVGAAGPVGQLTCEGLVLGPGGGSSVRLSSCTSE
ncbi:MAG: CAP domain-containing protein [Candidatus Promineifilaceae bacterium]|nr:CAP domain-containing protein [Candidatus Promineifilaceae bacterium]